MWGRRVLGQEDPRADHPSQHSLHPFPRGFSLAGTRSQGGSRERSESRVWKTFPRAEGLLESFPLTTSLILLLHRAWGGLFSLSILLFTFFFFFKINISVSRGQNIPMEKVKLAQGRLRALEMEPWILALAAPWELEWGTVSPGMSGIGDTSETGSMPRTGNPGSPLLHLMGAVVSWASLVSETHISTIGAEPLGGKLYCCFGHPKTPPWSRRKRSHSPCWDPIAHSWTILCSRIPPLCASSYPALAFLNISQAPAWEPLNCRWVENPSPAPHTAAHIPG